MKTLSHASRFATAVCALAVATLLLAGCIVTSIYPFYTAKDLTFDPALIGVWTDADDTNQDAETWTFEKIAEQTYKLTTRDSSETNEFDAHLFTLGKAQFLDCLPRSRQPYSTPSHVLIRVESIQPRLEMYLLDYEWLGKLVQEKSKTIRHIIVPNETGGSQEDSLLVLTADTAELQKFIHKHLKTDDAWKSLEAMKKR